MNNSEPFYQGYRGQAKETLKHYKARVWAEVALKSKKGTFEGIILPRSETDDDRHIVLKLNSGYNVGVRVDNVLEIKEKGYKKANYKIPEKEFPHDDSKPDVTLLGTGGTIASRLDYRTGAVIPTFSPGELYGAVPELADICNLNTITLFGVFSENIGPEHWIILAKHIDEEIKSGVDGIVIGHGTDVMHYTSAVLSFMVQNSPVPIVCVGSQRSSDRPSSDAARNLISAVRTAAYGDIAEVMICMFGSTSDQYDLLHRGTRVRKMHSSIRSTFRTIGDIPLAMVWPDQFDYLTDDFLTRDKQRKPIIDPVFEVKVSIVYYYPNMQPDIIDSLVDNGYKGIVIAGTGLGHVNHIVNSAIERAVKQGVVVVMTVQTLWGYVQMYVYETGRDLLDLGVIPLANMLPETAYCKLGWVLAHTTETEKVKAMMMAPINHELTEREPYNGYLIMQGGVPEVEEFLRKVKR